MARQHKTACCCMFTRGDNGEETSRRLRRCQPTLFLRIDHTVAFESHIAFQRIVRLLALRTRLHHAPVGRKCKTPRSLHNSDTAGPSSRLAISCFRLPHRLWLSQQQSQLCEWAAGHRPIETCACLQVGPGGAAVAWPGASNSWYVLRNPSAGGGKSAGPTARVGVDTWTCAASAATASMYVTL